MSDEQLDRMIRDADPYRPDLIARLDGADQTLLEEIMSDNVVELRSRSRARHGIAPRVTAAVAAAAAVAGVLTATAVLRNHSDDSQAAAPATSPSGAYGYSAMVLQAAEQNPRLLIDESGWKANTVYGFTEDTGTIRFAKGDRELEMNWYPAKMYDDRYANLREVSTPKPVTVDRRSGSMVTYSASDFGVLLKPYAGSIVELRTDGAWNRADVDAILTKIVRVDVRTWLAALPDEIVSPAKAGQAATKLLAGVPLPPQFDRSALQNLGVNDPYQFSAAATSLIGCGWINEWLRARKAGDATAAKRAADALHSSHQWKVLVDIENQGGWSQVFWDNADQVYAGQDPVGYQSGLGCK
jgi:hypothetical protein